MPGEDVRADATVEVRRLAEAFVRETPITHPAIAQIGSDAPAAVRYERTRSALLGALRATREATEADPERCTRCGATGEGIDTCMCEPSLSDEVEVVARALAETRTMPGPQLDDDARRAIAALDALRAAREGEDEA